MYKWDKHKIKKVSQLCNKSRTTEKTTKTISTKATVKKEK